MEKEQVVKLAKNFFVSAMQHSRTKNKKRVVWVKINPINSAILAMYCKKGYMSIIATEANEYLVLLNKKGIVAFNKIK